MTRKTVKILASWLGSTVLKYVFGDWTHWLWCFGVNLDPLGKFFGHMTSFYLFSNSFVINHSDIQQHKIQAIERRP